MLADGRSKRSLVVSTKLEKGLRAMAYTVFLERKDNEETVSKQTFGDYEEAYEFAETWSGSGLTYTIVEIGG